jgi:hypothetical protein
MPFAVCLSYPTVFVAGAISLVLVSAVFRDPNRAARGWFIACNLLFAASFLGHLLLVGREGNASNLAGREAYMQGFWHHGFPESGFFPVLGWLFRVHVGKIFSHPVSFNGGGLLGLVLVALGIRLLLRQGQRSLVLLCVLPYGLHLLAALVHRYPYGMHPRLEQHLLPGYCLLAGAGLTAVIESFAATPRVQSRWLLGTVSVLVLVGVIVTLRSDGCPYEHHEDRAQWARGIRRTLEQEMQPDDRLCLRNVTETCLRWQLLVFADRFTPAEPAGRLWILDQKHDYEGPGSEEPAPSPPDESRQRITEQRRFRVVVPDGEQHAYRIFCDLYRCEPVPEQQADTIGN